MGIQDDLNYWEKLSVGIESYLCRINLSFMAFLGEEKSSFVEISSLTMVGEKHYFVPIMSSGSYYFKFVERAPRTVN